MSNSLRAKLRRTTRSKLTKYQRREYLGGGARKQIEKKEGETTNA